MTDADHKQTPAELLEHTAKTMVEELHLKACQFRLLSRDQKVLEHVTSYGLSEKFLDKGPVSALRSIASALQDGQPVAIFDVTDDPRVQYPEAAQKEGIASILSVPMIIGEKIIG